MKISTWKTSNGNVISVITSAGIYYPVGPLGSYRLSASMASAGQTAALEVITLTGESKGVLGISVNGTTSISAISTPGNQAILNSDIGIKVSAISGTLNLLMDDGRGVVIKNGYAEASLVEILSATKIPTGIRARPFDVAGCTLEMGADGLWTGSLGTLTQTQFDALPTGNLSNSGVTATVDGILKNWSGTTLVVIGGSSSPAAIALSGKYCLMADFRWKNLLSSATYYVYYYVNDAGEYTGLNGYNATDDIAVIPNAKYVFHTKEPGFNHQGCWYTSAHVFIATIESTSVENPYNGGGVICSAAPANAAYMRVTFQLTGVSTTWGANNWIFCLSGVLPSPHNNFLSESAIGDSIVAGYGLANSDAWWKGFGKLVGVTNYQALGVSGTCIANYGSSPISRRLPSLSQNNEIICFEGGGNDFNNNVPLGTITDTTDATFYGALNVCATYFKLNHPYALTIWWACPRWNTADTANTQNLTMNDYMDAFLMVGRMYGFICVDAYHRYSLKTSSILTKDGIHPNDFGSSVLSLDLLTQFFYAL